MTQQFKAGHLFSVLDKLRGEGFTGAAHLAIQGSEQPRSYVATFSAGALTYVGNNIPAPYDFVNFLRELLKLSYLESALSVVETRVKNKDSIRELLDFLSRFGLFQWEDAEAKLLDYSIQQIEKILPFGGTVRLEHEITFDLSYGRDGHGFDWEQFKLGLKERLRVWKALSSVLTLSAMPLVVEPLPDDIPGEVRQHLALYGNGKQSLQTIAEQTQTDALDLAKRYLSWSQKGWVQFRGVQSFEVNAGAESSSSSGVNPDGPVVLSVDDSPVVQTMIKRAIGDRYQVLLANNAVDALNILNTKDIAIMLLDVTMPDIDGLELCRTVRSISKFRDLPVIMLTAKDGLVDKVKGQFAGSTQYLTKPVDRDKLLAVIEKYTAPKNKRQSSFALAD